MGKGLTTHDHDIDCFVEIQDQLATAKFIRTSNFLRRS